MEIEREESNIFILMHRNLMKFLKQALFEDVYEDLLDSICDVFQMGNVEFYLLSESPCSFNISRVLI